MGYLSQLGEAPIGVAISDPLMTGVEYSTHLTFASKDAKVVATRAAQFANAWNSKYAHRFKAKSAKVDKGMILIQGWSVNGEAMSGLKFENFWGSHLHVENIHWIDTSFLPSSSQQLQPGQPVPPANIPTVPASAIPIPGVDPSTPGGGIAEKINNPLVIGGIAAVAIGAVWFLFLRNK